MIIDEITLPADIEAAGRHLYRAGYHDITHEPGHTGGSYADVLWRADLPYVVKLFLATDRAYLRYLNLIMTVSNPHFPVVRGKPVRMGDGYGVRLEKLTPITGGPAETTRYWMESCLEYLNANNINSAKASAAHLSKTEARAIGLIYVKCVRHFPGTYIDLHKYNVMLRGSTPVIIDPIDDPA